ncbi:MAG: TetR/AcrR family transcriptional regulator C-terminal domain-containing protein [Acidimicrobiales bacterium]
MAVTARRPASLDRASILVAALELVDEVGLDGLNMRALALRLGVGTMSLYHWLPNKDALLDGIVEALLLAIEIPAADAGAWAEKAAMMARSLRSVALQHPNAVPLMVTRPFATGDALRPCNAAFDVLAEGGLTHEQALIAFRAIVAYVFGFVMMETAGFFGAAGYGRDPDELRALGLPRLAEIAPHLAGRDISADFDAGLRILELGALGFLAEADRP